MNNLLAKLGTAFGASVVVTEAVNLQPLWTALITFAVSILSVLTVEGVSWLKQFFKSKKAKSEAEEKKYAQQNSKNKEE